jgi:hypothetical protein
VVQRTNVKFNRAIRVEGMFMEYQNIIKLKKEEMHGKKFLSTCELM